MVTGRQVLKRPSKVLKKRDGEQKIDRDKECVSTLVAVAIGKGR